MAASVPVATVVGADWGVNFPYRPMVECHQKAVLWVSSSLSEGQP